VEGRDGIPIFPRFRIQWITFFPKVCGVDHLPVLVYLLKARINGFVENREIGVDPGRWVSGQNGWARQTEDRMTRSVRTSFEDGFVVRVSSKFLLEEFENIFRVLKVLWISSDVRVGREPSRYL